MWAKYLDGGSPGVWKIMRLAWPYFCCFTTCLFVMLLRCIHVDLVSYGFTFVDTDLVDRRNTCANTNEIQQHATFVQTHVRELLSQLFDHFVWGPSLWCIVYYYVVYNMCFSNCWGHDQSRRVVFSSMTSEDGNSHLDLRLPISRLFRRPNDLWRRNIFCSTTRWDLSLQSLLNERGEDCGLKRSEFEGLYTHIKQKQL